MSNLEINIADKLIPVWESQARYKILYGGRGGSKSWFFALLAVILGYQRKKKILCLRWFQTSIKDSVLQLLTDTIERVGLQGFYTVQENKIIGKNGTEFVFKGLARNINNIKSFEDASIAWVTEAVDVSKEAWKKLTPTIRKAGSQIWIDFNPEEEEDATYQRFVANPPEDSIVVKINYYDNPFLTDIIKKEMEYDKEYNPDEFDNIWLGECAKTSDAQIMKGKWEEKEFKTPEKVEFYYGSDWGNSGLGDPDCIVRFYVIDGYMYIDQEAYSNVQQIEEYPEFYDSMKGSRENVIRCDNTMEKFRRYLNDRGFSLVNAKKGAGSVEAGIKLLRSFKKIYVHPRCKHTKFEMKNYKYKVDPRTGEVLNIIIDKHNHIIDSIRYAAEPFGKPKSGVAKRSGW